MNRRRRAVAILSFMAVAAAATAWTFMEWRSRAAEPGKLWAQGVAAINAGNDAAAKEAFGKCLALRPGDAQCSAGVLLLARHETVVVRTETVPAAASAGTATDDDDVALAIRLLDQGRYPAAVAVARAVLERDPGDHTAYAIVKMYGDRAAAATYLAKGPVTAQASEDDQRRAIKHWNDGIRYFQKNEPDKAREEWQACKRVDPTNSECVEGLKRLDSTYGDGQ